MKKSTGSSKLPLKADPHSSLNGPQGEIITSGRCEALVLDSGVELRHFVSRQCGAQDFSTGTATFQPGAEIGYHRYSCSEALTVLSGQALISIEGRSYVLRAFDCIHIPCGMAHRVRNISGRELLAIHFAFASPEPASEPVENTFQFVDRSLGYPRPGEPEHVIRQQDAPVYELSDGSRFCDLFAGRFGAVGICGGYGEFNPGSSLPCHTHRFDESITIVRGEAICEVAGSRCQLGGYDTAYVPRSRPHRFLNESSNLMAMIWVYAGSEPERTIVHTRRCTRRKVKKVDSGY